MNNVKEKSLSGIVSLRDMLKYSVTNDFVFHGSPVALEPGIDLLMPHQAPREDVKRLYLSDFSTALRFALVRGWGIDQKCGLDFYVFATQQHRIVIYASSVLGANWYNLPIDKSVYLYAIARGDLEMDLERESMCAHKSMPIVARATVNQDTLADAGFSFAGETEYSTTRWWGVKNTDEVISCGVLPHLLRVMKRNRR